MAEPANPGMVSAPPPPPEVKVRTMRSDLESMAKSGGGLPRFQNVQVSGLSIENAPKDVAKGVDDNMYMASRQTASGGVIPQASAKGSGKSMGILIVILVAIVAFGAVAYFAYTSFFAGK